MGLQFVSWVAVRWAGLGWCIRSRLLLCVGLGGYLRLRWAGLGLCVRNMKLLCVGLGYVSGLACAWHSGCFGLRCVGLGVFYQECGAVVVCGRKLWLCFRVVSQGWVKIVC